MSFSAKEFAATLRPWTFTDLAGREHPARELSAVEVLRWFTRFEAVESDPRKEQRLLGEFIRRLFPWQFWKFWRWPDPAAEFEKLPPAAQQAALTDFFGRAGLRRRVPRPPTPTTPSPRSSPSSRTRPSGATAEATG